jgi:hypothetical protein
MLLFGGRPRSDVGDGHVDIRLLTFWVYSQVRIRLIVFGRYGLYPWEMPRGPNAKITKCYALYNPQRV